MSLKSIAETIVANRKQKLRTLAKHIVDQRQTETVVNVTPEFKPHVTLPATVLNVPEQIVNVSVEDKRKELQPVPLNVSLVVPPESIKLVVNPTINIPPVVMPDVNIPPAIIEVNVPEMPTPTVEVTVEAPKPDKKPDPPKRAIIKHPDTTESIVELE